MPFEHPGDQDSSESDVEAPTSRWKRWFSGLKAWQTFLAALLAAGAALYVAHQGSDDANDHRSQSASPQPSTQRSGSEEEPEPIVGLQEMTETPLKGGAKKLSYMGTVARLAANRRLGILVGPLEGATSAESMVPPSETGSPLPLGAFSLADVDRKKGTWQLTVVVGKLGPDRVFRPYGVPPDLHAGCTGEHPCGLHYSSHEPGKVGTPSSNGIAPPPLQEPPPGANDLAGLEELELRDLR